MICDAENRSKAIRGEKHYRAKLTDEDVRLIRQIHTEGLAEVKRIHESCGIKALSEKFGVHRRTIEKVIYYDGWRHVA